MKTEPEKTTSFKCRLCGSPVTRKDLKLGLAVNYDDVVICYHCLERIPRNSLHPQVKCEKCSQAIELSTLRKGISGGTGTQLLCHRCMASYKRKIHEKQVKKMVTIFQLGVFPVILAIFIYLLMAAIFPHGKAESEKNKEKSRKNHPDPVRTGNNSFPLKTDKNVQNNTVNSAKSEAEFQKIALLNFSNTNKSIGITLVDRILKTSDTSKRIILIHKLGETCPADAEKLLDSGFASQDYITRSAILISLAYSGDKRHIKRIYSELSHKDPLIRKSASEAIFTLMGEKYLDYRDLPSSAWKKISELAEKMASEKK